MVLGNREIVEYSEDAFDDLNWRIRVVRILADPHLQESATIHLQKYFLNVLFLKELRYFLAEVESIQSHLAIFDSLIIKQASVVHFLNQIDGDPLGVLLEGLLSFDSASSLARDKLATSGRTGSVDSFQLGQKLLPLPLLFDQTGICASVLTRLLGLVCLIRLNLGLCLVL